MKPILEVYNGPSTDVANCSLAQLREFCDIKYCINKGFESHETLCQLSLKGRARDCAISLCECHNHIVNSYL